MARLRGNRVLIDPQRGLPFSDSMSPVSASPVSPPGTLIFRPHSYVERLRLNTLFPSEQPLEVELGSGDGGFLAQWAALHPARNFLGVERLLGRLRKLDRKGLRAGLTNLRVMRIEAGYCLEYLLPAAAVTALHVYFPDPWPKRRHRKHRLLNEHFVLCAVRSLAPGGTVYLRTDDPDYFARMLQVFGENNAFQPVETPPDLAAVLTDFECDFQARGVQTLRAAFRLR